ncbi:MAG: hypothetical protein K0V04_16120 [Deltaproteobacteria bacterium]|nr:hypothetical protein [Deltaproteobacteria bacterium]
MFSTSDLRRASAAAAKAVRSHRLAAKTPSAVAAAATTEGFAVGGGCNAGCKTKGPVVDRRRHFNDCYHQLAEEFGCPLKVVSGGVRGEAALTSFRFPVVPVQANYFLPIALRLVARSNANALAAVPALLTAVTIKNIPQETFHDPSPTAATVQGVEFAAYFNKSGAGGEHGVPGWEVAWGPFSRDSDAEQLILTGFNFDGAVAGDFRAEIWGYELDSLPMGWRCGQHPCRDMALAANTEGRSA